MATVGAKDHGHTKAFGGLGKCARLVAKLARQDEQYFARVRGH